ncbi:uncharacterized protein BCR38DRAFT_355293 [Pseudomassariella vexata]|uniref:RNAse P Rpr2/Rpp21/SNM1 subunit domain-domain-containing protein n=1 Tax=Pseudomassariella vexata TaxID=1141098 RepID=A0A1Y2DCG4_9PEZI|nr:uncharacterized protein BCR38DRAFT_355293 [Pseudomassariella vexata]ORY56887.1 hypothetical protein BCR38DRAFT_355293 [Pseudomassariella vexata]
MSGPAGDQSLSTSLSFLTDAAHLLSKTSPEVSAHLMTQRNALMFSNDLPTSDVQRQHVCGCCGHIMILGQGSTLKLDVENATQKSRNSRRIKDVKPGAPSSRGEGRQKHMTCGMCGRYTNITLPIAPAIARRTRSTARSSHAPPSFAPSSLPPATDQVAKGSANARSKQRAKDRKKQGLQALLQQSQSSSNPVGFGLSLSDFMQK